MPDLGSGPGLEDLPPQLSVAELAEHDDLGPLPRVRPEQTLDVPPGAAPLRDVAEQLHPLKPRQLGGDRLLDRLDEPGIAWVLSGEVEQHGGAAFRGRGHRSRP